MKKLFVPKIILSKFINYIFYVIVSPFKKQLESPLVKIGYINIWFY